LAGDSFLYFHLLPVHRLFQIARAFTFTLAACVLSLQNVPWVELTSSLADDNYLSATVESGVLKMSLLVQAYYWRSVLMRKTAVSVAGALSLGARIHSIKADTF
jgi:hypothetical protein